MKTTLRRDPADERALESRLALTRSALIEPKLERVYSLSKANYHVRATETACVTALHRPLTLNLSAFECQCFNSPAASANAELVRCDTAACRHEIRLPLIVRVLRDGQRKRIAEAAETKSRTVSPGFFSSKEHVIG